jgi:hypothetical protein
MKRIRVIGLGLVVSLTGYGVNKPWAPSIEFGVKNIFLSPAKSHENPFNVKIEILESEGCEAKVQSSHSVQFSESCEFVRGLYEYSFRQSGTENKFKIYSEFLLHQSSPKSRTYLINSPIVVAEGL